MCAPVVRAFSSAALRLARTVVSKHLGVGERRVAGRVGQVELDLEPDRAPLRVEARLAQHAREDVEVPLDLVPVALPVVTAEDRGADVFPHGRRLLR